MSGSKLTRATQPPRRTFGAEDSALDDQESPSHLAGAAQGRGRVSFSGFNRRPSLLGRWRNSTDEETGAIPSPTRQRPAIPSALQQADEVYATPLPALSMIVLSITLLGEFLSANVSAPFILFMVQGFGQFPDEARAGYWTGILASTFFLTQFLTSLLWVRSLYVSAITCCLFGTSTSLQQAVAIRLMQGIFAGAVGVARGCITTVERTHLRVRFIISLFSQHSPPCSFCWGFGGVAGAIVGGTFESPAVKWPSVFAGVPLFNRLVEKTDAIPEDEATPTTPFFEDHERHSAYGSLRSKLSGYFTKRSQDANEAPSSPPQPRDEAVPLSTTPSQMAKARSSSQTSRANGSAYGYSGAYRSRLSSAFGGERGSMAVSMRRKRGSNAEDCDLNFAQRLLMANENAVTNIADLWVASAMNADNEDPFESDSEFGDEEQDIEGTERAIDDTDELDDSDVFGSRPLVQPDLSRRESLPVSIRSLSKRPHAPTFRFLLGAPPADEMSPRRMSIFSHVGVRTPPAVLEAQQLLMRTEEPADSLAPISESGRAGPQHSAEQESEKEPSLMSQLPVLIIIQYGLLALHSTTHDQIFYLYLVSKYPLGGLNLNAGHFSQLIALMCLAQIAYQFYLYPPPRGRFSHLSMFRIGSLLFIPSYLSVILYRVLASPDTDGNPVLMGALALSTAIRFCGGTFAYTAVSVLLNYMSPPHVVGFANGIAQSIVSLARFFGPILGGTLWSTSVEHGPEGYPLGFIVCAGACALAVAHSFFIR
ncbi:hypothetical protein B0H21DRAFT_763768 [Amylocystis lapponica]|nr:hypothetical protein B0H21DRAFT_763768 [Amylocystis lapponica]